MPSAIRIRCNLLATGLRLFLAASILGTFLGEQSILCIEADGQSHFEVPSEICCTIGDASDPCGAAGGEELMAAASCLDCRDFPPSKIVQGRPADRGTAPRPVPSPGIPLASPSNPALLSSFLVAGQHLAISPVLLTLRTVVLSC